MYKHFNEYKDHGSDESDEGEYVTDMNKKGTQFKANINPEVENNFGADGVVKSMLIEHVNLKVLEQQCEMRIKPQ